MGNTAVALKTLLRPEKFRDPDYTASGERRAYVHLDELRTLWFNTGTLCNLACANCYIESSPRNDALVYLSAADVRGYLGELRDRRLSTREIGFTGGEPFMNPEIMDMLGECLGGDFRVLVLTNATRPMMKLRASLLDLNARFGDRLTIRVSLDHYSKALHEFERGLGKWQPVLAALRWLSSNGFNTHVAGRTCWGEPIESLRRGYSRLFSEQGIDVDASDATQLLLFPEMDAWHDVPEITEKCWKTLGVSPKKQMCASSRMVVKRKGAAYPTVVSCTLLPYDKQFEMGRTLKEAEGSIKLNHPNCSRFCVLGGGSCSSGSPTTD